MWTYIPFKGGCNACLLDQIKNKKAILNVPSHDNMCFVWHVLASLYPLGQNCNTERISKYRPYINKIDCSMSTYPVKLNEILKFEKVNHLKINVMTIDGKFVVPLQLSKSKKS